MADENLERAKSRFARSVRIRAKRAEPLRALHEGEQYLLFARPQASLVESPRETTAHEWRVRQKQANTKRAQIEEYAHRAEYWLICAILQQPESALRVAQLQQAGLIRLSDFQDDLRQSVFVASLQLVEEACIVTPDEVQRRLRAGGVAFLDGGKLLHVMAARELPDHAIDVLARAMRRAWREE